LFLLGFAAVLAVVSAFLFWHKGGMFAAGCIIIMMILAVIAKALGVNAPWQVYLLLFMPPIALMPLMSFLKQFTAARAVDKDDGITRLANALHDDPVNDGAGTIVDQHEPSEDDSTS
jgi:hypothetical protein